MRWIDSTAIKAIDYDDQRRDLFVRFVSGEEYLYHGVAEPLYFDFAAAPSKGRFFSEKIRDHYAFDHLTEGKRG
jgi:KTSC domain-containing protein